MSAKSDARADVAAAVIVVGGVVVLFPAILLWFSFAAHLLWAWFVVPLGAPPISVAHTAGLWFVALSFGVHKRVTTGTGDTAKSDLAFLILAPGVWICFGAVIRTAMNLGW